MSDPVLAAGAGLPSGFMLLYGPARSAPSSAAAAPADEHGPMEEAALHAAIAAAPQALGSLMVACAGTAVLLPAFPWRGAWMSSAGLLLAAMAVLVFLASSRPSGRSQARACARVYAHLSLPVMLLLVVAPWLPGPQETPPARHLLLLALGMAGVGVAAAFASLRLPSTLAVVLPLSPALAPAWGARTAASAIPIDTACGLLLGGLALAVGLACRRTWLRDTRQEIARGARMRALEQARDAALNADRRSRQALAQARHDLRQPVNALGLFAAALEEHLRAHGEESLAHNLVCSVDGLDRSLGAILEEARMEPVRERIVLDDVFGRVVARFATDARQARLQLRASAGAKRALGDAHLLEALLVQLVAQALRTTRRGGVALVARRAGELVNIEVWDTGDGLGPNELSTLRGDAPGDTAIGLAIARRLAHALGCRLSVASRHGRGTVFRIGLEAPGLPIQGTLPEPRIAPAASFIGSLVEATARAGRHLRPHRLARHRAGRQRLRS